MISSRAREIKPFIVMDVMARAEELEKQGEDVIHLEVGRARFRHTGGDSGGCHRGDEIR